VIVTAQSDRRDRLRGIEAGCDDFLTKPFDSAELHARIQSLVRLKRYTDELESAEAVILGLAATIEARDPLTNGHCQRLAHYATRLGGSLNLDESDLAALERGGFLHDIGKIAVPDSVLLKDGSLDPQESRVMRKHPIVGDSLCAAAVARTKCARSFVIITKAWTAQATRTGLRNAEVPLLAQIISIVGTTSSTRAGDRTAYPRRAPGRRSIPGADGRITRRAGAIARSWMRSWISWRPSFKERGRHSALLNLRELPVRITCQGALTSAG
jgi:putative two-component system response regulator